MAARSTKAVIEPTAGPRRLVSAAPSTGWIISPVADVVFFLATPLLLVLLFRFADRNWSFGALAVFSTVLAMGHYLPGLMRAYGDPELFRRFRWRFLLAPLFFIPTAIVFTRADSQAFLLVVVIWGAWHWLMQTYGLARIYAAKNNNFDAHSARLDYALCLAWFGVLYGWTDGASGVLMHYYRAGGQLSPGAIQVAAWVWCGMTALVTLLYCVNLIQRYRAGHRPSVLKFALLTISFFYYLYAFGYSSSKLIAFGLFEGYHDIQYLAIVWVFNRNRASKDPSAGSFTRFLFRQRWPLVLLYVVMCLAFGSYDFVARSMSEQEVSRTALSIITGLALIHFYFDGFIWRIREPTTRATLNVDDTGSPAVIPRLSPALRHALMWLAVLLPVGWLIARESGGKKRSDEAACRAVLAAMPSSHKAHYLLASVLTQDANHDEAMVHAKKACALRPGYDLYEMLYADLQLGEANLSTAELEGVVQRYQSAESTRAKAPLLHRNWARALRRQGKLRPAAARYRVALVLDPSQAECYFEYATVMAQLGDLASAQNACEQACRIDSKYAEAHALLGSLFMAADRPGPAVASYRTAVSLAPEQQTWQVQLALALATASDPRVRDFQTAAQIADSLHDKLGEDPRALQDLSMVYAALGDKVKAAELASQARYLIEHSASVAPATRRSDIGQFASP